jgi:predicted  nucleic acid-binding Zn-ribbon protein
MGMAEIVSREEIKRIVLEILKEELGIDKIRYLDILERLTRLEEGQKMIIEIMNKRFEDINKRFEDINRRFEDINKRFEDVNKRFEDLNKRFEDINSRFTMLTTFMAVGFSTLAALMVVLKIFS